MSDPREPARQPPEHQPPAYQPPGYGQQPGYGVPTYGQQGTGWGGGPGAYVAPTSGKATTVMVLGISSLVLMVFCGIGFIPAVIALVLAGGADREIAASGGVMQGAGQVRAGRIMSWISLGITLVAVVGVALVLIAL